MKYLCTVIASYKHCSKLLFSLACGRVCAIEGLQEAWLIFDLGVRGELNLSTAFSGWLVLLLPMLQYVMYLEVYSHTRQVQLATAAGLA